MKVSASPFEAPVGTARSGDKATMKTRRDSSLHLVRSPSASPSVRAGLDSATKEALRQLADLVQDQSPDGQQEDKDQDKANHSRRDSSDDESRSEKETKNLKPIEPSSLQAEPGALAAVVRLQNRFDHARKQHGREVYRQVLRDQAMSRIEEQFRENLEAGRASGGDFDDALELVLNLGAEFLEVEGGDEGFSPAESSIAPRASLKRVA